MYTSLLVFALSGLAPAGETAETPSWLKDYGTAGAISAQTKKPLAVFLGQGANSWQKLSREGTLPDEAKRILASMYVCLHIDTTTAEGKRLAEAFQMPSGLGVVISDRTGELQAFRHESDLSNADLIRYLQRYGDENYTVRTTESNPSHAVSASGYGRTSSVCSG